MSDLPKVKKDADDLTEPEKKGSWRKVLTSALAAIAASVSVGATPTHAAITHATLGTSGDHDTVSSPAKLVFRPGAGNFKTAQHVSHESHMSHESHASHYSSSF